MNVALVNKLIDRIIDLVNYDRQCRKTLLDNYISPIYSEFEKVHGEYLKSFEEYRNEIQSYNTLDKDSLIFGTIEKDNLFSMNMRTKIIEMTRVIEDNTLKYFIHTIQRYLITAVVDQNFNDLDSQRWRNSFLDNLRSICVLNMDSSNADWVKILFDLDLLDIVQLNGMELDTLCNRFNINVVEDSQKLEKLKVALAIHSIDKVVENMQNGYQLVTSEYNRLKKNLS